MQGFFGKPVDNLFAEPLIARWIRANVPKWKEAVVVSKNAGGTKRVTSLADALKLNFGIVTTDRMRPNMNASMMESSMFYDTLEGGELQRASAAEEADTEQDPSGDQLRRRVSQRTQPQLNGTTPSHAMAQRYLTSNPGSSPLVQNTRVESSSPPASQARHPQTNSEPTALQSSEEEAAGEYTDERARDVITGRLVQGHIVDDDYPSPALSARSASMATLPADRLPGDRNSTELFENATHDPMTSSFVSTVSSFQPDHALGGTFDATATSDEEEGGLKNPEVEHTITLVGNVKDKTVFIMDDMIDKSGSWIAAAETVVKKGGAKRVYCIGTHGLFGDDSLEEMEECECIDYIVVTNSFPISPRNRRESKKLVVIDLSNLLSEAIRRNHYGGRNFRSRCDYSHLRLTCDRKYLCTIPLAGLMHEKGI